MTRNVACFKHYLQACHPSRGDLTVPSEAEHTSDGKSDSIAKNPSAVCPGDSTDPATDDHMNFPQSSPRSLMMAESEDPRSTSEISQRGLRSKNLSHVNAATPFSDVFNPYLQLGMFDVALVSYALPDLPPTEQEIDGSAMFCHHLHEMTDLPKCIVF
ncbi:hypothetical protein NDU88_001098 [Pleurodeles waltl]|uniref:Uncharacterized protein n=1 Tax=Pleurodeles waltl TaxID=8319 RepID=A0AAV7WL61_PLEWA|nr:hypothetical protein NDU88_001098 [Pleurodeles waltl]